MGSVRGGSRARVLLQHRSERSAWLKILNGPLCRRDHAGIHPLETQRAQRGKREDAEEAKLPSFRFLQFSLFSSAPSPFPSATSAVAVLCALSVPLCVLCGSQRSSSSLRAPMLGRRTTRSRVRPPLTLLAF